MNEKQKVSLIVKCLYENTFQGKTDYNIHSIWYEMLDIEFLEGLMELGLIRRDGRKIWFTPEGKEMMDKRYANKEYVHRDNIYRYLNEDVVTLTNEFESLLEKGEF